MAVLLWLAGVLCAAVLSAGIRDVHNPQFDPEGYIFRQHSLVRPFAQDAGAFAI